MPLIEPADLAPFATIPADRSAAMIADATAMAVRAAPCLADDGFPHGDAARAILRAAILRWHEAGVGALSSETIGPYSYQTDTRQTRRGMFWPSEITQLQDLCRTGEASGAYAVDTVTTSGGQHADICALNFGAAYCSCGAVLTQNLPLYENL